MHHGLQKLHKRRDDEDEHHGLQIIEVQRDKYIRIHGPVTAVAITMTTVTAQLMPNAVLVFGNAEERTDAENLLRI